MFVQAFGAIDIFTNDGARWREINSMSICDTLVAGGRRTLIDGAGISNSDEGWGEGGVVIVHVCTL